MRETGGSGATLAAAFAKLVPSPVQEGTRAMTDFQQCRIKLVQLGRSASAAFDAAAVASLAASADLVVLVGAGRSYFVAPGSHVGVLALRSGQLHVDTGDLRFALEPDQIYVSEFDRRLEIAATAPAEWTGVLMNQRAWRLLARLGAETTQGLLPPIPALHPAAPVQRRVFADLAASGARLAGTELFELGTLLTDLQAPFLARIARCPGRTFARKLNAYVRMQRVYNYIEGNPQERLVLGQLARLANYSPAHLVRAYATTFGETPSGQLARVKLACAQKLLRQQGYAVSDVASACGFESRTAFSRAFKRCYGVSPSDCSGYGTATASAA